MTGWAVIAGFLAGVIVGALLIAESAGDVTRSAIDAGYLIREGKAYHVSPVEGG